MPKKILMVSAFYPPYHLGGACMHVHNLANELAKDGHEVHVLYSSDAYRLLHGKMDRGKIDNHANVKLHDADSILRRAGPLYSYVFGGMPPGNFKKIFDQNFDVIHYHNLSLLGPAIMKLGKAKKIYTAHDHWLVCPLNDFYSNGKLCDHTPNGFNCSLRLLQNSKPPQLWRFTNLLEKSLSHIDRIITPSGYLKGFLTSHGLKFPMTEIPNFVPAPPKIDAEKQDYFLYVGMLEDTKGVGTLLETAKDTNIKLKLAGTGSQREQYERFVKKNGMDDRATFLGWVSGDERYKLYKEAIALILPSKCPENNPLSIMEALSVGTPTIGSNIGGIPGILNHVDPSLLFTPGNVKSLREKIMNFDGKKYQADALRDIYEQRYSPHAYMNKYLELIDTL